MHINNIPLVYINNITFRKYNFMAYTDAEFFIQHTCAFIRRELKFKSISSIGHKYPTQETHYQ